MITDDSEIPSLVEEINTRMQELQNYIGDRNIDESRIKFPRGYLRTCEYHREKYAFLRDPVIEKNISYTLLATDVYRWLLNRTDLGLSAQGMIVKHGLILICSIVEVLVLKKSKGLPDRGSTFKSYLRALVANHQLNGELDKELRWLWDTRQNVHLSLAKEPEHNKYEVKDYNRAVRGLFAARAAFDQATEV